MSRHKYCVLACLIASLSGFILALSIASLSGSTSALTPSAFDGGQPEMRPETFFAGATNSSGVLENRAGAPTQRFHVKGVGHLLPDGSFQLDQVVDLDPGPPKTRTWILRRVGPHQYSASLTDASGPVEGEAYGDLFHLRYPMKTPAWGQMEQWMYLQPDGRTVVNEATISVLGIVVAHLSERITHEDR